ncbi:MAG TPA: aminotransferase class V-fold PLP-dependent enzyme [Thermoleophilaceae bacterium]|nr:aminotransferase class V-fold PLP-dependent enzyme [Thermoleophilaceae bacterium]
MNPSQFRAQFPVLQDMAYLNAGTDGPIPAAAAQAARERIEYELASGRSGKAHFEALIELNGRRRELLAELLHCEAGEVALTHSTTDGVNIVLGGLDLKQGDEVLTSDEEHPGLLAPLAAAQRRAGIEIRQAPFAELANAVTSETRLVATSHVSWLNGQVVDSDALKAAGAPVLLDGAQGIGAVPVDVNELGCTFYAASGQKWLCGPDGTGCLYVNRDRLDEVEPGWLGYPTLEDPSDPMGSPLQPDARRLDLGFIPGAAAAWSVASLELFADSGWDAVHERAATLAAKLADMLAERGLQVEPRGRSTLLSWHDENDEQRAISMGQQGVVVRHLHGRNLVRASVGAWNDEGDLERLVAAAISRS